MRARPEPLRWPLRWVALAYGLLALAPVSAAGLPEVRDPHSYADLTAFRTRHLALDLGVDFRAQRLTGTATLTLERRLPEARELTLDTRDLDIRRVTLIEARRERRLPFTVAPRDALLGSALHITLPADLAPGDDVVIRIVYRTSPTSTGLQWLAPRQTAGRKWPFLYSQSEALHARSWIPLQDTPQARITYTARIRTPRGLRAVMSAVNDPDTPLDGDYTLTMPQPIPSYLLALAVGDLDFRALGPRTGVYAEPATVQAAAAEFADTEAMLTAAEKLVGPYRWERYDLLLLPPSYALGGMENARLTFVTPTLLAGDRSLVAVIAHELAHSWSGNLVTNATWGDLWLNEGITCFLESSIVGAIYGADRQAQEDVLGWQTLERELARLPSAEQVLARDLNGLDPDEYTEVPYEKGRAFLKFLERRFGSERFAAFLRAYFEQFAFQSISTRDFRAFLDSELGSREPGRVTAEELDAWLYAPGLPASAVPPRSEAFTRVDELSGRWQRGELAAAALPVAGWSTQQWRHFLNSLPVLEPTKLAELDAAFGLTASTNAEIAASWLRQSVLAGYRPAWPRLEQYLQTIGRRKLLLPLYEVLLRTPEGTAFARRVYAEARPGYQILVRTTLDPLIEGTR